MRIAVAGGNGFIGRHLTRRLLDSGHQVVWLSHCPGKREELGFDVEEVREIIFNCHDLDGPWIGEVAESDAVVNLSGHPLSSRWSARTVHLIRESRIDTTRALARAAVEAREEGTGPGVFVSASGSGIYGDAGDDVLDETAPPGSDWLARFGVEWEAASLPVTDSGIRRVVMRTGVVLGEAGFLPRVLPYMRSFVGGPLGAGRQWFPWIHIEDAAAAYAFAIEHESLSGAVNVSAREQVRMREFMRVLGHTLHRPSWLPVPVAVLRLAVGRVAPYLVASQRMKPAKLEWAGFEWRAPELKDALAMIAQEQVRRRRRPDRVHSEVHAGKF
jgi:hypothetical protein